MQARALLKIIIYVKGYKIMKPKKLDAMTEVLRELDDLRAQLEKLGTRKKELEQEIRDRLGPAEEGTVNGVTVVTYGRSERAEFDQSAFKRELPDLAKRYITYKPIRTFLLKTKAFGEAGLR